MTLFFKLYFKAQRKLVGDLEKIPATWALSYEEAWARNATVIRDVGGQPRTTASGKARKYFPGHLNAQGLLPAERNALKDLEFFKATLKTMQLQWKSLTEDASRYGQVMGDLSSFYQAYCTAEKTYSRLVSDRLTKLGVTPKTRASARRTIIEQMKADPDTVSLVNEIKDAIQGGITIVRTNLKTLPWPGNESSLFHAPVNIEEEEKSDYSSDTEL
jgi:hypothetical protein